MKLAELEKDLQRLYGPRAGSVFRVILPGILADFTKMIKNAGPDDAVREEYHLEDGKGVVVLECQKKDGTPGEILAYLK